MLTKKILIRDLFRKHLFLFAAVFVAGFLNGLAALLIPVFIGKYYQVVLQSGSVRGAWFDNLFSTQSEPAWFFLFFGLLISSKAVFLYFQKYLTGFGGEIFSKSLRENLLARQLAFTMDTHNRKPVGKYLLRYSGDLQAIQRYVSQGIITFIIDMLFIVLAFSLMFYLQRQLAWIVVAIAPVVFVFFMLLNRKLKVLGLQRRNIRSENLSFVSSRLNALLTIKIFNREKVEEKKFEKNSTKLYNYGIRYYRWLAVIESALPFFLYLLLGAMMVYVYFIRSVWQVQIPASTLVIFLMLTIHILPVMRRIIRVNTVWQAGDISFQKVLNIMNAPQEERNGNLLTAEGPSGIMFKNVVFSYSNKTPVLSGLSFSARANEITLIKGLQGSGKSTVLKLLLGLYQPSGGTISVDGVDTGELSAYALRKEITLVSDDVPLLGKTIFESVSYSRREEQRAPVEAMLRKLNFRLQDHGVVDLDYRVEEHGANLSKGQRKLLLITRALLTRKKVLLLDEPFSGLDDLARENFIKQLNQLKTKRTIIIADSQEMHGLAIDQVVTI